MKAESNQAYDAVETRFAGPWLIPDPEYLSFVERLFADAGRRCLVSIFLVGNAPGRDQEPLVVQVSVHPAWIERPARYSHSAHPGARLGAFHRPLWALGAGPSCPHHKANTDEPCPLALLNL